MLGCRRCFQATPSRQNLCDPFAQTGTTAKVRKTHAEDNLHVTGSIHSHDLDSNLPPLVCAL